MVGTAAAAAFLGGGSDEEKKAESEIDGVAVLAAKKDGNDGGDDQSAMEDAIANATATPPSTSTSTTADLSAIPAAEIEMPATSLSDAEETKNSATGVEANATESDAATATVVPDGRSTQIGDLKQELEGIPDGTDDEPNPKDAEEEFATKLQAAEQEMKDALVEAAGVKEKKQQQQQKKSSLFDNDPPVTITTTKTKTTNFVYEDDQDDSDWLRILSEIREEVEAEDEDESGMVDYAALVNNNDDMDF